MTLTMIITTVIYFITKFDSKFKMSSYFKTNSQNFNSKIQIIYFILITLYLGDNFTLNYHI